MAIGAGVAGVLALVFERDLPITFDVRSVSALLYLAIAGSAVTFSLYYWLLRNLAATRLSLITYGIPVVAVFLGTMFLDEPLTARMIAGGVLVLFGVGFALRR
jgi:drug/metabolite transporter (DMT)-like permease